MNCHNVYLVFPMKIKKGSNVANGLADDVKRLIIFLRIGRKNSILKETALIFLFYR